MQIIDQLLNKKYDNHILPFLWMHGEDENTIRHYIAKIDESGIKAVCLESRPHPDYLSEGWWRDVGVVLAECKQRNMQVWFFDDQHFPTGYAGGALEKAENTHLQKTFLAQTQLDFVGPQSDVAITVSWAAGNRPNIMSVGQEENVEIKSTCNRNQILTVLASRKTGFHQIDGATTIDVTGKVTGGVLCWDIPEGDWTISVLYTTQDNGEVATKGYLNPLVPEATDLLIDNVYEKHYVHFKSEFGRTIAGFFSDEPRFGNIKGPSAIIGQQPMPLPWSEDVINLMVIAMKIDRETLLKQLPSLFNGETEADYQVRYAYMNVVSKMYKNNFSLRIGRWCRKHHVRYIGHVIEDNNAHARLGYGAGHFFRSMAGQDMAGIDVVLHQLLPQQNKGYFNAMTATGWDGEFFHYALAELGSSLGRLDPTKAGQTMCELFGAFGWAENLTFMKWLADHMLVRGVNQFVPHAFTMKPFPDPDCPPHFYADGHDPSYAGLPLLMTYMNRVATMFSGGQHVAQVGVLYHGEAEWSGEAMLLQKVTRQLVESQTGFEIVPTEWVNCAEISSNGFQINQTIFKALIVPYSQRLPYATVKRLVVLAKAGVKVIIIDAIPSGFSDHDQDLTLLKCLKDNAEVKQLKSFIGEILNLPIDHLITGNKQPDLRYYHYRTTDGHLMMLFNENTIKSMTLKLPLTRDWAQYDPMTNTTATFGVSNTCKQVTLLPAESMLLYSVNDVHHLPPKLEKKAARPLQHGEWQIKLNGHGLKADLPMKWNATMLPKLGQADGYRNFVGTVCYRTSIMRQTTDHYIELGGADGMITLFVDGKDIGTRIGTPYRFKLPVGNGKQLLELRWTSNLAYNQRDYLSQYMVLKPLGFVGDLLIG